MKTVSFVLPFFNEFQNVPTLLDRLQAVCRSLPYVFEFVFVNDCSTDGTKGYLLERAREIPGLLVVNLSRNFGHQTAVFCGLTHASGDAVIIMDTDLQDRPEAVPAFLEQWEKGAEVVYAVREKRKENPIKRTLFASFHRMMARLSEIRIPVDAGLFSLMDRRVVDVLLSMPERNRYIPGLRAWVGFRQVGIPVERDSRGDKTPRVSLTRLTKLAMDAIFSFSTIPLRTATLLGIVSATGAFIGILVVLDFKLIHHIAIPGWASTMIGLCFFGGVQLLTIGILGEYLGRIYEEVKRRPPFVVSGIDGTRPDGTAPQPRKES